MTNVKYNSIFLNIEVCNNLPLVLVYLLPHWVALVVVLIGIKIASYYKEATKTLEK